MRWPSWTIYTVALPTDLAGSARGPVVCIRPKYRSNLGLHAHEYEHVRQWWASGLTAVALIVASAVASGLPSASCFAPIGFALHPILYAASRRYRLWAEVRAYRMQMMLPNTDGVRLPIDGAAVRLINPRYRFDLTIDAARAALMRCRSR